jgi:hypothetical protein
VRDMRVSLEFYRLLGLDIPEGVEDEPHAVKVVPRLFVWIYECGVHTSMVRLPDRLSGLAAHHRLQHPRIILPTLHRRHELGLYLLPLPLALL